MSENEPRPERPWVRRGGGQGERSRLARMVLALLLVVVIVATNGFGALPENPLSRSLAGMLAENLPSAVLEPVNGLLTGISQPVIQANPEAATEAATPTHPAAASPSPTATETPSPEPTASFTSTFSATPPAVTDTPTLTATVTPEGFQAVVNVSVVYLYLGPGNSHPHVQCELGIYCSYRQGTPVSILGRNATYGQIWYLVTMPDGAEGWVLPAWLLASVDPSAIPLVAGVPTPPPTPIPTEAPTDTPEYAPSSTGTPFLVLFDRDGPSLTLRSIPVTASGKGLVPSLFTALLSLSLLATLLFVGWEEVGRTRGSALRTPAIPDSEDRGHDFLVGANAPPSAYDPYPDL